MEQGLDKLWGLNIWAGEQEGLRSRPEVQLKVDIILVGGLASDPKHAWFYDPNSSAMGPPMLHDTGRRSLVSLLSSSGSDVRHDAIDLDFITPQRSFDFGDFRSVMSESKGCFWPQQLLPDDFPNARIGTYAYRSRWDSNRFTADLDECSREMLSELKRKRQTPSSRSRPIIFVGHSFGGLVIQSALLLAAAADEQACRHIRESCKGVIFLGTPFQGTRFASAQSFVNKIRGNPQPIIDALKPNNPTLQAMQQQFKQVFGNGDPRNPELVCFYEQWGSASGSARVVSQESASLINYPNAGNHPMNADHRRMNKFRGQNDDNYQLLCRHLSNIYDFRIKDLHPRRSPRAQRRGSGPLRHTYPDREGNVAGASGNGTPQRGTRSGRPLGGEGQGRGDLRDEKQAVGRIPPDLLESVSAISRVRPISPQSDSTTAESSGQIFSYKVSRGQSQVEQERQYRSEPSATAAVPSSFSADAAEGYDSQGGIRGWTTTRKSVAVSNSAAFVIPDHSSRAVCSKSRNPELGGQARQLDYTQCPNRLPEDLRKASSILGIHSPGHLGAIIEDQSSGRSTRGDGLGHSQQDFSSPHLDSDKPFSNSYEVSTLPELVELPATPADLAKESSRIPPLGYPEGEPAIPSITEPVTTRVIVLPLAYDCLLTLTGVRGNELPASRMAISGLPGTGKTYCTEVFLQRISSLLRGVIEIVRIVLYDGYVVVTADTETYLHPSLHQALTSFKQATGVTPKRRLIVTDQLIEEDDMKTMRDWSTASGDAVLVITTQCDIANAFLQGQGPHVTTRNREDNNFTVDVSGKLVLASQFLPSDWVCFPSIVPRMIRLMEETEIPHEVLQEKLQMMLSTTDWLENKALKLAFSWAANMFYNTQWPPSNETTGTSEAATLLHILVRYVESSWLRVLDGLAARKPEVTNMLDFIVLMGTADIDTRVSSRLKSKDAVSVLQDHCILVPVKSSPGEAVVRCPSAMNITAKVWLMNDRNRAAREK